MEDLIPVHFQSPQHQMGQLLQEVQADRWDVCFGENAQTSVSTI